MSGIWLNNFCFISVCSPFPLLSILYISEGQTLLLGLCLCTLELIPCEALPSKVHPDYNESQHILPWVLSNYADNFFVLSFFPFLPNCCGIRGQSTFYWFLQYQHFVTCQIHNQLFTNMGSLSTAPDGQTSTLHGSLLPLGCDCGWARE